MGDGQQLAYRFARAVLRPTLALATTTDWRGQDHVPAFGGCVVATNHLSHFDPFTVAHFLDDVNRAPRFLGKAELFEVPLIGRLVSGAGQIPVARETVDAARALQAAISAVAAGECVVIYPEGTLTRDRNLWPMVGKTGAARVSLMTGCPVVPVAQWGPQAILGGYQRVPRLLPRHRVHVWAGPPVDLTEFQSQSREDPARPSYSAELLHAATAKIMQAITRLLGEIRGEQPPTELFDPRAHTEVPRVGNPTRHPRLFGGRSGDQSEKRQ